MVHVLVGQIVVTVDGVDHPVHAGRPWTSGPTGCTPTATRLDSPARLVMIVAMPPGEFDRRRGSLIAQR